MTITWNRSTCPHPGCASAVTHATERELRDGEPLWRCRSDHHGPRFVGFDEVEDQP